MNLQQLSNQIRKEISTSCDVKKLASLINQRANLRYEREMKVVLNNEFDTR